MKKFLNEFKEFAVKGNMLDMAIGMIIGGAFAALVNSIVDNLASPIIGMFIGVDLRDLSVTLPHLYGTGEPAVLEIGLFLNNVITFISVAFVVFLFVKVVNRFKRKQAEQAEAEAPPEPAKEELLLTEIRDILKDKNN
ncbi:MAG: large-conductance mechanosensitive channel protein MscL [Oscillospiraceae bacterium]|nr:large-conductance mechanosensitive channel protein MscL [Oscillospiraceae bacterium]